MMSALLLKADIGRFDLNVCLGPIAHIGTGQRLVGHYSCDCASLS
jgi:hypothetical protein